MPSKVKVPPRLWKAIGVLELAGTRLSNIAFNLSQQEGAMITKRWAINMRETWQEWDEARRVLSRLL